MFLWLPLPNLPKVPQHFIDKAMSTLDDTTIKDDVTMFVPNMKSYESRKLTINEKETNTLRLIGKSLGDEWEQWVRENIVSNFINTGVRVAVGKDTTTHGAHCDVIKGYGKVYKFYYLLNNGGDNAETVFFKQNGYPLERSIEESVNGTGLAVCDYSELTELARMKIPTNQWLLLNTSVLHGVENASPGKRIHLTVITQESDIKIGLI